MAGEVVAVPNHHRRTWVAACVVPSPDGHYEEYVRVVSSGHPTRMAAQTDALEFALWGQLARAVSGQPPR